MWIVYFDSEVDSFFVFRQKKTKNEGDSANASGRLALTLRKGGVGEG